MCHFVITVLQSDDGQDTCNCEGKGLSAGVAAGIAVTATLLLALPVSVVIGLGVAWCGMGRGRGPTSEGGQQKCHQLQGAINDGPLETTISLRDNQAYGYLDMQRINY